MGTLGSTLDFSRVVLSTQFWNGDETQVTTTKGNTPC